MVAKWRQVRSHEGRMPIGSFVEPESFISARFYKGFALTVILDFFGRPVCSEMQGFPMGLKGTGVDFFGRLSLDSSGNASPRDVI